MHKLIQIGSALGLTLLVLQPAGSAKPMVDKPSAPTAARLIVKFANVPQKHASLLGADQRAAMMVLPSGVGMHVTRALSGGARLVSLDHPMTSDELNVVAETLSAQPGIQYAEPDVWLNPALTPNDLMFPNQYYLQDARVEPSAINTPLAWNLTTGSAATVVAVIDTGIRPDHIDIAGRLVPGYDFISPNQNGRFSSAHDGDGRDVDPSDPGDACNLYGEPSSWHGTRVASLIGAVTNDGQGMAGVNWSARILPARTLGSCGGRLSDFLDAGRWAAGLPVPGVPNNPNPAKIINLSFESGWGVTCSRAAQEAIDDITSAGALVVVAAGNDATNALRVMPANCSGVLPVGAVTRGGGAAPLSNGGIKVALSAPGVGILTAANRGFQAPISNSDTYSRANGTSFSSPLVAGVAALMLSLNSSLTPQQLIGTLRATARAFPVPQHGLRCTRSRCGAGLLNAAAAVQAVAAGHIVTDADGGNGLHTAFARAVPLAAGIPRRATLGQFSEFDVYKVTLPLGGKLSVATAGGTDVYGYLFNASGKLLAQQDDIDPASSANNRRFNENFRIDATLMKGTYYIAVEGFSRNSKGPYTLTAQMPS
jgi:serine protease